MKFCFLIQGFWLIDMPIVSLTCQNRSCISKLISEWKLYDPISVKSRSIETPQNTPNHPKYTPNHHYKVRDGGV